MNKEGQNGTGPFVMGWLINDTNFAVRISEIEYFEIRKDGLGVDICLKSGRVLSAKDATMSEMIAHVQGVK